jgi:hypothetical protein
MVIDKLGSYSAAKRELIPGVEHRLSLIRHLTLDLILQNS